MATDSRKLLLLEPDALTRWSVARYLARWFDVLCASDAPDADRILDDEPIAAVVISDSLPWALVEELEDHARRRNPTVRAVRTIAYTDEEPPRGHADHLEKPFDLSRLARLLGVGDNRPD